MDTKLLKAILYSCDDVIEDVEKSIDYEKLQNSEKFVPVSKDIPRALSTSLTNLLCHKVSKEAYQRYSVRLNILDILRNWCKVSDTYAPVQIFRDGNHLLTFVTRLIKNHLTDEIIDSSDSVDSLVSLTSTLVCLFPDHSDFKDDIERLIVRLVQEEENDECDKLLCYIAGKDDLNIKPSIIEQIYIAQKRRLIEDVLLDNFLLHDNLNETENEVNTSKTNLLNRLLDHTINFSSIFHLVVSFLKELFIHLNYAPKILLFIEFILKKIIANCENQGKDIIDLYPRRLHYCIILLRIEPSIHSVSSKDYTLDALQNIFQETKDDALILLSHFPLWLKEFSDYKKKFHDENFT